MEKEEGEFYEAREIGVGPLNSADQTTLSHELKVQLQGSQSFTSIHPHARSGVSTELRIQPMQSQSAVGIGELFRAEIPNVDTQTSGQLLNLPVIT